MGVSWDLFRSALNGDWVKWKTNGAISFPHMMSTIKSCGHHALFKKYLEWHTLLCNLPRDASCRLRSFWNACWRNLKTISGIMSLELEFDLPGKMRGQRSHACVNCPGTLAVAWDNFGASADVISERYHVPLLLNLNYTFKMTLKIEMKVLFVFSVPKLILGRCFVCFCFCF